MSREKRSAELFDNLRCGRTTRRSIVETLTPMLISINARYKAHAGIRITGLPEGDPWE